MKINQPVAVTNPETGARETLPAGKVPSWAEDLITNPNVIVGAKLPEPYPGDRPEVEADPDEGAVEVHQVIEFVADREDAAPDPDAAEELQPPQAQNTVVRDRPDESALHDVGALVPPDVLEDLHSRTVEQLLEFAELNQLDDVKRSGKKDEIRDSVIEAIEAKIAAGEINPDA